MRFLSKKVILGLLLVYSTQAYLGAQSQSSQKPGYVDRATMMEMMKKYNAGRGARVATSKSSLSGEQSYVISQPGAVGKPGAVLRHGANDRTLDPLKKWNQATRYDQDKKRWGGVSDYNLDRKMWDGVGRNPEDRKMWNDVESYSQGEKMWGDTKTYSDERKMWGDHKEWASSQSISTENRYESKVIEHKKMPHTWYVDNGKEAWVGNTSVMREVVKASKFENALLFEYPDKTYDKIKQHVDGVSMSDINRFNFRRNHSTEPGLLRQSVGRTNSGLTPVGRRDWKKLAKQMRKNASRQLARE